MKDFIFCDKVFKIAFAASLISHCALLLKPPNFHSTMADNTIEVTYLEQKSSADNLVSPQSITFKSEINKRPLELKVAKSYLKKEEKPETIKEEVVLKKRKEKVIVKKTDQDFRNEKNVLPQKPPEFYDYYQYLRKRIEEAILYPHHFQEGEILVNFTLYRNGRLKEISVVDDFSVDNAYLRYAAIQSVKEASPFKPFPKELAMKEIPFQIFISFEFLN